MGNYWDELMGADDFAAVYMHSYNEGPGCETRRTIGSFINNGETILDVGCGPGWNLDHFVQYGPKISNYRGIDYSERFVRVANERHKDSPVVRFKVGDCRDINEPDSSWDVVILQDVLEHTSGYEKPIAEALRVARKRVIVTFWRGEMKDGEYVDTEEDTIRDDGNDGWHGAYSRKKWEAYLDSLGYHWLETESTPQANRWHRFYCIDKEAKHG